MTQTTMTEAERLQKLQFPAGRIPLVIDTDAKNETDDQFAIAWALRHSRRFSVEAVYAAPFSYDCIKPGLPHWESHPVFSQNWTPKTGMLASYDEIRNIYKLLGLDPEGKVFYGAEQYLTGLGKPVESDATRDLIARARRSKGPLYVAAIGACTNIASALLLAPDLIDKLVVVWLGGELPQTGFGGEFNMMQDVKASQVLLDCGVPLIWIPCRNVASSLTLTRRETKTMLAGKNPICDYLAKIILDAMETDEQWEGRPADEENSRIIWDMAAIAALTDPHYVETALISAPILKDDLTLIETSDRHTVRMGTACDRDAIFHDLYDKLFY